MGGVTDYRKLPGVEDMFKTWLKERLEGKREEIQMIIAEAISSDGFAIEAADAVILAVETGQEKITPCPNRANDEICSEDAICPPGYEKWCAISRPETIRDVLEEI